MFPSNVMKNEMIQYILDLVSELVLNSLSLTRYSVGIEANVQRNISRGLRSIADKVGSSLDFV